MRTVTRTLCVLAILVLGMSTAVAMDIPQKPQEDLGDSNGPECCSIDGDRTVAISNPITSRMSARLPDPDRIPRWIVRLYLSRWI